jgi:endonuclease YncB( thermonuclease family)
VVVAVAVFGSLRAGGWDPSFAAGGATAPPPSTALMATRAIDGDTVVLSDGSRVRLAGIDTPERGQCGHGEATALLASLVEGRPVVLHPAGSTDVDRYGRLIRYVEHSGSDVNLAMIDAGRAVARYDSRDGYGAHIREPIYVAADTASPSVNRC